MSYIQWGWFWLIFGFLGVGFGSVISTFGWSWMEKTGKKKYKMWWLCIIVGLMLAGTGAVFSTWGWDNMNKQGQKDALLFALIREATLNGCFLLNEPLRFDVNGENIGEKHNPYPQFHTNTLKEVMISDMIPDPELSLLAINYIQYADICNHYFASFNDELGTTLTQEKRKERYVDISENFGPLNRLRELQEQLDKILKDRYPKHREESYKPLLEEKRKQRNSLQDTTPEIPKAIEMD